jgi:hypothetical protein
MMARVVLVVFGLMFLGFGLAAAAAPLWLATLVDLEPRSPLALTELRAFYGGLEIGLGTYLLACAASGKWQRGGLQALVAVCGGIALGRIFGMAVDGTSGTLLYTALVTELAGAILGTVALTRLTRS